MANFDENYESEGESIFSNLSCLSNDRDTQVSAGDLEPSSPVLIDTDDHRPRVSSVDNSVHSASQSINTFKRMNSPVISGDSSPLMTILSKTSSKSPNRQMVETDFVAEKNEKGTMGWDFSKLKVSEEPSKFSLNDNKTVLPRAQSPPSKPEAGSDTFCDFENVGEKSKYTGRCKAWYTEKGFGFIRCNEDSDDYFCHFTSIVKRGFRSLQEGDMVGFDLCDNSRKAGSKMCKNVTLV